MNEIIDASPQPSIAFVRSTPGVDDLVARFASLLIGRGWRVRGLVQVTEPSRGHCSLSLVDLDNDTHYPISQELGSQSTACRVDQVGIAEATAVMRRIAAEGADLVIFNRYAGLEAIGQGFSAEMLAVMELGIPVLTTVSGKHTDTWQIFTGGLSRELEPRLEALEKWFSANRQAQRPGP